jgi:hypothetical protein
VNVATPPIHVIASVYGVTRQRVHQMRILYGLTPADFRDADLIFSKLLTAGNHSKTRKALSNPEVRESIKQKLK